MEDPPFLSSVNHLFLWAISHGQLLHDQRVIELSQDASCCRFSELFHRADWEVPIGGANPDKWKGMPLDSRYLYVILCTVYLTMTIYLSIYNNIYIYIILYTYIHHIYIIYIYCVKSLMIVKWNLIQLRTSVPASF